MVLVGRHHWLKADEVTWLNLYWAFQSEYDSIASRLTPTRPTEYCTVALLEEWQATKSCGIKRLFTKSLSQRLAVSSVLILYWVWAYCNLLHYLTDRSQNNNIHSINSRKPSDYVLARFVSFFQSKQSVKFADVLSVTFGRKFHYGCWHHQLGV